MQTRTLPCSIKQSNVVIVPSAMLLTFGTDAEMIGIAGEDLAADHFGERNPNSILVAESKSVSTDPLS